MADASALIEAQASRVGTQDGRTAASLPSCRGWRGRTNVRPITHARLIRDWQRTLDAFGAALESERRYFSRLELKELERHLAADRRWLERFATIHSFP